MRCSWVNEKNTLYIKYHDLEWGIPVYDDQKLFEMLILEMFQGGLSWETILNKRENFRKAFDNFELDKIINYNDKKIKELLTNKNIINNKEKIISVIKNAKIFKQIEKEYNSFSNYIWNFTNKEILYEDGTKIRNTLSDQVSIDLKKRGMKYIGSKTIYAYLSAIGVIYSHEKCCKLFKKNL